MSYKYHIGLDVHTRNCFYAVMDLRGKLSRQGQISTCEDELLGLVRSVGEPKALVFEESTVSHWLHLLLHGEVDKLVVCDPAAITKKPGAKNDRIDAIELADLLRVDRLNPVFHTVDERMELRTLVSGYNGPGSGDGKSQESLQGHLQAICHSTEGMPKLFGR